VRRGCGGGAEAGLQRCAEGAQQIPEGCGGRRAGHVAGRAAGCGGACQCKCVGKTKESSSTRASQRKRRATKAAEALTCLVRVGVGVRFRVG